MDFSLSIIIACMQCTNFSVICTIQTFKAKSFFERSRDSSKAGNRSSDTGSMQSMVTRKAYRVGSINLNLTQ